MSSNGAGLSVASIRDCYSLVRVVVGTRRPPHPTPHPSRPDPLYRPSASSQGLHISNAISPMKYQTRNLKLLRLCDCFHYSGIPVSSAARISQIRFWYYLNLKIFCNFSYILIYMLRHVVFWNLVTMKYSFLRNTIPVNPVKQVRRVYY